MMAQLNGYETSRQTLKLKFGKTHEIARSHIDSLTAGKQLGAKNCDWLMSFATEMQKCMTTLDEIGYQYDLNSTQTLYVIMPFLPAKLRQK